MSKGIYVTHLYKHLKNYFSQWVLLALWKHQKQIDFS